LCCAYCLGVDGDRSLGAMKKLLLLAILIGLGVIAARKLRTE
jgi:hypothetical protein